MSGKSVTETTVSVESQATTSDNATAVTQPQPYARKAKRTAGSDIFDEALRKLQANVYHHLRSNR